MGGFTKDEIRELEKIKVEAAVKFKCPPRPWTDEQRLEIMRHNIQMTPVHATRYIREGHYRPAKAMLNHVLYNMKCIEGFENGTMEIREDGEFIYKDTKEVVR